ncbi:MAG: putative porin [Candidatus Omnitrophica bacterium]|nr:putative porin [Candidatus Omnitrophota bacterium]
MLKRLMVVATLIFSTMVAFGSEVDRLLDKLVEKGILTEAEAYKISLEAQDEVNKQEAIAKTDVDKISKWIKNTSFKGDARIRYEVHDRELKDDRHRTRLRFRWGFDTKVNDQIKAGFRIATGDSAQASSANQTFTNSFDDKPIWLDRAYITYTPAAFKNLSFTGGKMSNPFYNTNLVWSSDINPEGVITQIDIPITPTPGKIFATAGYFPVYESKDDYKDPYMLGLQAGYENNRFKSAVSYYHYDGLKGGVAKNISPSFYDKGNTLSGGKYVYDYHLLNLTTELTLIELPFGENKMPLKLYGDYVNNIADDVKNKEGYLFGIKLGKAKNKKTWEFGYDYRRIESDAITDFMADGSFCEGGTDSKGHTIGFKYATSDNSTLGISYMITEGLGNKKTDKVNTLQIDFAVAF